MTPNLKDIHFAADHPTAPGHFPGYPIIPGAVLLDELVQIIPATADHRAAAIRTAKFFRPVHPGQSVTVSWHVLADGALRFECHITDEDTLVASGVIEIAPVAA